MELENHAQAQKLVSAELEKDAQAQKLKNTELEKDKLKVLSVSNQQQVANLQNCVQKKDEENKEFRGLLEEKKLEVNKLSEQEARY
jgi:hypothetical protein